MGTPTNSGTKRSLLSVFSSPPAVAILALISVFSLGFAIWEHFHNIRERCLTYYVDPARAIFVYAGLVSDLSVSYKNQLVKGSVCGAQIRIWNSGRQPIESGNVLSQPRIVIQGARVLEVKVVQISRPVTELSTLKSDKTNIIPIAWRTLEHNDGGIFQVIYEGPDDAAISVEGIIREQPKITSTDVKLRKYSTFPTTVFGVYTVFLIVSSFFIRKIDYNSKIFQEGVFWFTVFFAAVCLCIFAFQLMQPLISDDTFNSWRPYISEASSSG